MNILKTYSPAYEYTRITFLILPCTRLLKRTTIHFTWIHSEHGFLILQHTLHLYVYTYRFNTLWNPATLIWNSRHISIKRKNARKINDNIKWENRKCDEKGKEGLRNRKLYWQLGHETNVNIDRVHRKLLKLLSTKKNLHRVRNFRRKGSLEYVSARKNLILVLQYRSHPFKSFYSRLVPIAIPFSLSTRKNVSNRIPFSAVICWNPALRKNFETLTKFRR